MLKAKNLFTLCGARRSGIEKGSDQAVCCAFYAGIRPQLVRAAIERPATMRALCIQEALL
jgi:hypothetical protein